METAAAKDSCVCPVIGRSGMNINELPGQNVPNYKYSIFLSELIM